MHGRYEFIQMNSTRFNEIIFSCLYRCVHWNNLPSKKDEYYNCRNYTVQIMRCRERKSWKELCRLFSDHNNYRCFERFVTEFGWLTRRPCANSKIIVFFLFSFKFVTHVLIVTSVGGDGHHRHVFCPKQTISHATTSNTNDKNPTIET